MPHGHGRGRCGQPESCVRRVFRFLEPCLLLLLHCREAYGYQLLEELKPFGFEQNAASLSAAYRILRDLEEQGMVVSRWDTEGVGPARRLYKITEEGDSYLTLWVQDLRETEQTLHQFLSMYEGHMEQHQ